MTKVVVSGPGQWALVEDVERRELEAGEVRLRVAGSGLCGTDLHTLAGENPTARLPITPGHEFVGTIIEIGSGVTGLAIGTRVAVDPSRSCGHCRFCLAGHGNVCPDKGGYGARYPGGFASEAVVLGTSCVPLPSEMRWSTAVLAEPTACVLNGADKLGDVAGRRALVFGAGTIGALCAAVLTRRGADVTVAEPNETRRILAGQVTGAAVLDPSQLPDDGRWDIVVDATGVAAVIERALDLLDRTGVLLVMGVATLTATVQFSPSRLNWQEQSILGSTSVNGHLADAVAFLRDSGSWLTPIVTDIVDLTEFGSAVERLRERCGMKIVVLCDVEETW